jgi:hypothetical protein
MIISNAEYFNLYNTGQLKDNKICFSIIEGELKKQRNEIEIRKMHSELLQ